MNGPTEATDRSNNTNPAEAIPTGATIPLVALILGGSAIYSWMTCRPSREQQQNNEQQDFGVPMMQQARLYIQIRQYQTALRVLSQISERDAQWYYLSGIGQCRHRQSGNGA